MAYTTAPGESDPWGSPGTGYPNGGGWDWKDQAWDWTKDLAGSLWEEITGRADAPWGYYAAGDPMDVCAGTPPFSAIQRAVQRAPQADVNWIIGTLQEGNAGRGPATRAELAAPETLPWWVKAFMGGRDCAYDSGPELRQQYLRRFNAIVNEYGAPRPGDTDGPRPALAGKVGAGAALALGLAFAWIGTDLFKRG